MVSIPLIPTPMATPHVSAGDADHTAACLCPEFDIAVAILRLAWVDAHAVREPGICREARTFWNDASAVEYWDTLLNLDGQLLRHAATLQAPGPRAPWPVQLWLFGDARAV
jgi:hypothetical protein